MKISRTVFLLLIAVAGLSSCSEEHLSEEELKTAGENIEKHYTNPRSIYSWGNISPGRIIGIIHFIQNHFHLLKSERV